MSDTNALFAQLFGENGQAAFDSTYLDFGGGGGLEGAGTGGDGGAMDSLFSSDAFSAALESSIPNMHDREASGSSGSMSSAELASGTVAPVDLSPALSLSGSTLSLRPGSDVSYAPKDGPSQPAAPAKSMPNPSHTSHDDISPLSAPPKATGKRSKKEMRKESVASQGDGSEDGKDAGGKKAKRTRNRKPSSCAQCRKKKLRCNRSDPCDQCTNRGEGHLCSWEGAEPLYRARDQADTEELRDQVRLYRLDDDCLVKLTPL